MIILSGLIGFVLGILFCVFSLAISFFLNLRGAEPLRFAQKLAALAPKPKARFIEPKSDRQLAQEEVLERHRDEGGVALDQLG